MRFGMMAAVGMLAATAGMAHGERESGKPWSVPDYLMAGAGEALRETAGGLDLTAEQEAQLWAEAQPLFEQLKQSPEETNAMWIPSLQGTGLLASAAAAIVAASPVQAADTYVFGRCKISRPDSGAEIRPLIDGDSYMYTYHRDDVIRKNFTFDTDDAKVTLIKAPSHGVVALADVPDVSVGQYHYTPNEGYLGEDRFVMQVERDGVKVRIQYLIEGLDKREPSVGVCEPDHWRISSAFTSPALDNAALQALLDATGINNAVTVTTADLTGAAVGQTTGSSITLDTNAAGYNWYIDYTPYLNDGTENRGQTTVFC